MSSAVHDRGPRRPAGRSRHPRTRHVAGLVVLLVALGGCAPGAADPAPRSAHQGVSIQAVRETLPPRSQEPSAPPSAAPPSAAPTKAPSPAPSREPAGPRTSDGEPQVAHLTIPSIDVRRLRVEPYRGRTDDGPGTVIQNRGIAASPHGRQGGVGPGGIGNYQVTAHRNTAGGPFADLPELRDGAKVEVVTRTRIYVYRVVETRETSFRSKRSLAEQRAAVPGHPGRSPSEAMITLSTCATQEDHAAGNYWADEFDNPEHRIDKIGVLVSSRST